MEKEGFGSCLQWLNNITEDSIKDYESFLISFDVQPTIEKNISIPIPIPNKVSKDKIEEDDDDYVVSGDFDSEYNSDSENEAIFNIDNFLDSGIAKIIEKLLKNN